MESLSVKIITSAVLLALFVFGVNHMQTLRTGNWAHEEGINCDFRCRMEKAGLANKVNWVGENLYKGNDCDIRYAISLWEASPTHKEILNSKYDVGVILIYKEKDVCYITFDVGEKNEQVNEQTKD